MRTQPVLQHSSAAAHALAPAPWLQQHPAAGSRSALHKRQLAHVQPGPASGGRTPRLGAASPHRAVPRASLRAGVSQPPLILCLCPACAAGNYIDHKCPFTGNVSIRGRILTGKVGAGPTQGRRQCRGRPARLP